MSKGISFKETITRYLEGEDEGLCVSIVVEGTYHLGNSGRIYGPPDDCYPPEGAEVYVSRAYTTITFKPVALSDSEEEELRETLGQTYGYTEQDAREYAREAKAEARYEAEKNGDYDDRETDYYDPWE
jgi:hypothetical protein